MTRLISAVLLTVLLGATGCAGAGSTDCTAIGCVSGVRVAGIPAIDVPEGKTLSIEACAADKCNTTRVGNPVDEFFVDLDLSDEVVLVTVTVRDTAGKVVATGRVGADVDVSRPNGPGCPPECRFAAVAFEAGTLVARS